MFYSDFHRVRLAERKRFVSTSENLIRLHSFGGFAKPPAQFARSEIELRLELPSVAGRVRMKLDLVDGRACGHFWSSHVLVPTG